MKRSAQKNLRGSPERLADKLMPRIFRGDYPPGSRLPAERHLARELGVDRTTLRMALKQLARMGLLQARHGSGIEVNDYRLTGGLDVLAAMFSLDELPLEGSFIVEALDFWLERLEGSVVAIGNAPTALYRLMDMIDAGAPKPAAIIGIPVGFVGAAESKDALAADGRVPFLIVRGRKGGSAMAAAVVNALASEAE